MSNERINKILELQGKGWIVREIAEELSCDMRTIYRDLEKYKKSCHQNVGDKILSGGNVMSVSSNPVMTQNNDVMTRKMDVMTGEKHVMTNFRDNILYLPLQGEGDKNVMTKKTNVMTYESKGKSKSRKKAMKKIKESSEVNVWDVSLSFFIKFIIVSVVIMSTTFSNVQLMKMDISLKDCPTWLIALSCGILEVSVCVIRSINFSKSCHWAIYGIKILYREALCLGIIAFLVYGSSRGVATENAELKIKTEGLLQKISLEQSKIKRYSSQIKTLSQTENDRKKNKWLILRYDKGLSEAENSLKGLNDQKMNLGSLEGHSGNEKAIFFLKLLSLLIISYIAPSIKRDFGGFRIMVIDRVMNGLYRLFSEVQTKNDKKEVSA